MKHLKKIGQVAFVFLAIFLGLGSFILWAREPAASTQDEQSTISREELLILTNKERAQTGKNPLKLDETLNATAKTKCEEIVAAGMLEHGEDWRSFLPAKRIVGENLASGYPSADKVIAGWLASPTHQANIVDQRFTLVGFGICSAEALGTVVVQHFSNTLSCADPLIKGNVSANTGEWIYHKPGDFYYEQTKVNPELGERWFCTEREAQDAGWRHTER